MFDDFIVVAEDASGFSDCRVRTQGAGFGKVGSLLDTPLVCDLVRAAFVGMSAGEGIPDLLTPALSEKLFAPALLDDAA